MSGPEVLFHALPSRRLLTRASRAGQVTGSIKAAKSAASFGEYVAGIEERDRVTRSVIFQSLYAEILASASPGAASCPAPRPLITLLWALEHAFSDSTLPPFIRVHGGGGGGKCPQAWAALRHDDHRGSAREISWCRRDRCAASCGAPRLPGATKWSSRDPSLSRPWLKCMMQGGYWLDDSFFWISVRRLEIFFFLPRPAE